MPRHRADDDQPPADPAPPPGQAPSCASGPRTGAHAAVLRRMVDEAPPFRPEATPRELVDALAVGAHRWPAYLALYARGDAVIPAVREGLRRDDWQIRRWCALVADTVADVPTLRALIPLVRDPKSQVRLAAVHAIACEQCKDGPNPIDAVPLLVDRIEHDVSLRVRRQAVAMLAYHRRPDPRGLPVLRRLLVRETDRKLRLHAAHGLVRYRRAGLTD